jgi:autotransporter-associated beta strand protein
MEKKFALFTGILFFLLFAPIFLHAGNFYSIASSNWNLAGTWSASSGGSAGSTVPGATDNVFIENGYSVTTASVSTCNSLSIAAGSTLNVAGFNFTVNGTTSVTGTLNHTSIVGVKLFIGMISINTGGSWNCTVAEGFELRGGLTFNGATFNAGAGIYTFTTNNQTISGLFEITIPKITVTGVTLTNNDSLAVTTALAGTGGFINNTNAYLTLRCVTTDIATFTASASGNRVYYAKSGDQTVHDGSYEELSLTNSGIKTINSVTVNTLLLTGSATASAAPAFTSDGTLKYTVSSNRTSGPEWITPFSTSGEISIAGVATITLNETKTLTGIPLTLSNGVKLDLSTYNLAAPSELTLSNGTNGVKIMGSGTLSLGGGVTVLFPGVTPGVAVISTPVALDGNRTITINDNPFSTAELTISGIISTGFGITKKGVGTLVLTNNNTYTGATTITAGEVRWSPVANITPNTQIVMNGGVLSTTDIAAGTLITNASTLKVILKSSITLGTNAHSLIFANSSGESWTGDSLTIEGWVGTAGSSGVAGKIFVGSSTSGLNSSQLARIKFAGYPYRAMLLNTGELVPGGPQFSISGTADHGSSCVGTAAAPVTYRIKNTGTTGSGITVLSNDPQFVVTDPPTSINGGDSATFVVTFTPASGGNKSATITVTSTSSGTNTTTKVLSGIGNVLPVITGTLSVCESGTTQLAGSGTPATTDPWTSATTSVATVDNNGLVSGLTSGTSLITYKDNNGCVTTQTVTVYSPSIGGTVAGGDSVYPITNSTVLTLSGHTGSVQRWQYSTDGTNWNNISGSTTTTFTATNLTVTTQYRAVVKNGACSEVYSTVDTVIMIFSTKRYCLTTGNWNSISTWSSKSGGKPGAPVPTANDTVYIEGGFTVTANAVATCRNLEIASGSTLSVDGFDFTVAGKCSISGSILFTSIAGTKIFTGNVTINPGGDWTSSVAESFEFKGGFTNLGGNFDSHNGTYTFSTNNQSIGGNIPITIQKVAVAGIQLSNTDTLRVITSLTGNGELINNDSSWLAIRCNTVDLQTLTATSTYNKVVYFKQGDQTVYPGTYAHLIIAGSGIKTTTGVTVDTIAFWQLGFASDAPAYRTHGTLKYNLNTARPSGIEWITPFPTLGTVKVFNTSTITLNENKVMTGAELHVYDGGTLDLQNYSIGSPSKLVISGGILGAKIIGTGLLSLGGDLEARFYEANSPTNLIAAPVGLDADRIFTVNDDSTSNVDLQIDGVISTGYGFTKEGKGILVLTNNNTYTGATRISQGELRFSPTANTTPNTQIVLEGGLLSTVGIASDVSITNASTLKVDTNSNINLETNIHSLIFANSSGISWTGDSLTINGWTGSNATSGTNGKIFFGSSSGGLTAEQLNKIRFTGYMDHAMLLNSGELVPGGPHLTVTGSTFDHGNSCTGIAASPITYKIFNTGTEATGITVLSNDSQFVVTGAPTAINAGDSATFDVTFTASGSGSQNATITIGSTSSGSNSPTIALTGNGFTTPTITGVTTICNSTSTQLTGSGTPATVNPWISATTTVAIISNTGLVTGISGGSSIITYTDNNGCMMTDTINVYPTFAVGTISADQSICNNTTPLLLTSTGPTGGNTPYSYQWQSSTDNINFADISTASGTTHQPGALTQTTYYRQSQTSSSGCGVLITDPVTITVEPTPVSGTLIKVSDVDTVCAGTNVAASHSGGSGGNGGNVIEYRTESASGWSGWNPYTPVNQISTDGISRVEIHTYRTADYCSDASPNSVSWVVNPGTVGGTISGGTQVCYGSNSTVLTLSNHVGSVQKWQYATDGFTWNDITGATTSTYTAVNLIVSTSYRAIVKSGTCPTANSTTAELTVLANYHISGYAKYFNNPLTPLNGLKIILKKLVSGNMVAVDSMATNNAGFYDFGGLTNAQYMLQVKSSHPGGQWQTWGGVNNTDALIVQNHINGVTPLVVNPQVVRVTASVKTPHPAINTLDYNAIRQAAKSGWGSFDIPKWVFSGLDNSTRIDTITLACASLTREIRGLCAGDVNGTYVPVNGYKMAEPGLELVTLGTIPVAQEIVFPIRSNRDIKLGAITLYLNYNPSLIGITGVEMVENGGEQPVFETKEGVLYIGWMSTNPVTIKENGSMLLIRAKVISSPLKENIRFTLNDNPLSELADADGKVLSNARLNIPDAVKDGKLVSWQVGKIGSVVNVYPNPASVVLNVEYQMGLDGEVRGLIYNTQGEVVSKVEFGFQEAGLHKETIDLDCLAPGVYTLKMMMGDKTVVKKVVVRPTM